MTTCRGALHDLTVAEASTLIAARKLSPVELVEAFLRRIEAVDARVHSYVAIDGDRALDQARLAEQQIMAEGPRGPLHGLPYGLKDNMAAEGLPMAANSRVPPARLSPQEATAHVRLRQAGAILIGKLHTYEYGTGTGADLFELPSEPARNPWNLAHFTGGSSTGSGAAVAAGTAMFALGADTGGSVRLPAAGCGVAGLKPTYGLVSRAGVLPNCYSLDHIGPLAQDAADIGVILLAIAGPDPADPASAPRAADTYAADPENTLRGRRIGVVRGLHDLGGDAETMAAFEAAIGVFRDLGAEMVEIDVDQPRQAFVDSGRIINMAECYAIHRHAVANARGRMGPALRNKLLGGALVSASDYLDAQRVRRRLSAALDAALRPFDAVICPSAAAAPRLDDLRAIADFTTLSGLAAFSISGHPALSICNGFTRAGLPTSLQIAGRYFAEADVLAVAAAYEAATRWSRRRASCGPPSEVRTPLAPKPSLNAAERQLGEQLALGVRLAGPTDEDLVCLIGQQTRLAAMRTSLVPAPSFAEEPATIFDPLRLYGPGCPGPRLPNDGVACNGPTSAPVS